MDGKRQLLDGVWDEHVRNEFFVKDTDGAIALMVPDAYVNHIPVLTGGVGREKSARLLRQSCYITKLQ